MYALEFRVLLLATTRAHKHYIISYACTQTLDHTCAEENVIEKYHNTPTQHQDARTECVDAECRDQSRTKIKTVFCSEQRRRRLCVGARDERNDLTSNWAKNVRAEHRVRFRQFVCVCVRRASTVLLHSTVFVCVRAVRVRTLGVRPRSILSIDYTIVDGGDGGVYFYTNGV